MATQAELDNLRKDIVFTENLRGIPFTFHSTWGIFSPRAVDEGSRLLLEYLQINPADDCLDLGCGYGPIGITLARLAPQGHTTLVDKDFVAVNYCKKNLEVNDIQNADAVLSNGFDAIREQQFDIIVSNIPAKVGNELLTLFLYDAHKQLKPGGKLYIVTINGLRQYMARMFKDVFGNYKKLKQGKNYTVALATKVE